MYSGTTLTRMSGRVIGAHQKIDRVARGHLRVLLKDNSVFPKSREILKFEGLNGPDGIKRKSPAKDEPWHYINPRDPEDTTLITIIENHYADMITALQKGNPSKVAFEAAWLAHALVDGLTPAHHYPYEAELIKLRGGESIETRDTVMRKIVMPGTSLSKQVHNNWKMWGPKGLMTTHGAFELGIANMMAPLSFKASMPNNADIAHIYNVGLIDYFTHQVQMVADMHIYESFYEHSWTPKLVKQVKQELLPEIIKTVTLAWYLALIETEKAHL